MYQNLFSNKNINFVVFFTNWGQLNFHWVYLATKVQIFSNKVFHHKKLLDTIFFLILSLYNFQGKIFNLLLKLFATMNWWHPWNERIFIAKSIWRQYYYLMWQNLLSLIINFIVVSKLFETNPNEIKVLWNLSYHYLNDCFRPYKDLFNLYTFFFFI